MRWELLKTIIWLRWRLSRNQLRKTGSLIQMLMLLLTILAVGAIVGVTIGGFLLGRLALSQTAPTVVMYIVDGVMIGFLFFWLIGILAEIQRSETIDLGKLLHFPVTLRDAFVVNFIASHVTLVVLLVAPAVTGLAFGLAMGRGIRWLVLLPLYAAFLFLISAWTYYLRGWLVQLMVNPRRRRTIIIALTMTVILAGQLPNIFFNVYNRRAMRNQGATPEAMENRMNEFKRVAEQVHYFVPPLWVGWGTRKVAEGDWWPAAGACFLFVAGGAFGLSRAYRSTLRFYRGAGSSKSIRRSRPSENISETRRPLEGRLPLVPDDVSAATLAFVRSLLRAPELKMALLGPILMVGVLAVVFLGRDNSPIRRAAPLAALGMTVFSFTGVLQIAFNQFGWDRTGFRALVLLPTPRHSLLLAKNLATGLMMLSLGLLVYVTVGLFLHVSWMDFLAGGGEVLAAVVMLCGAGNYLSIVLPVRMNAGSLRPTKMPLTTTLIMMLLTLLLPIYMIPVLIGPTLALLASLAGSSWSSVVNLLCSSVVLAVVVVLYLVTLRPLGELFWDREKWILDTVTAEVE